MCRFPFIFEILSFRDLNKTRVCGTGDLSISFGIYIRSDQKNKISVFLTRGPPLIVTSLNSSVDLKNLLNNFVTNDRGGVQSRSSGPHSGFLDVEII